MVTVLKLVPSTDPEKATKTRLDTVEVTMALVQSWEAPPFQRPVRVNAKLRALVEELRQGAVIPGIVTIGVIGGKQYILDGQHRLMAFTMTGLVSVYSDIRYQYFSTMSDMGDAFVALNDVFVRMKPDDVLRALESSNEPLKIIRRGAPFVGYSNIRQGPESPVVGMSQMVRAWVASGADTPVGFSHSVAQAVASLTTDEAHTAVDFLKIAFSAWGKDRAYMKMWGALNMGLCMWLYRNVVLKQYSPRSPRLSVDLFKKCLMGLSASEDYCAWLVGRSAGERDRSPAYTRIKAIFVKRYAAETGKKLVMPMPAWVTSTGTHG